MVDSHVVSQMTLNTSVIRKKRKENLKNVYTKWDTFRDKMDSLIDLKVSLKPKMN